MASDSALPLRVTPLMARMRSFTWMAPVLKQESASFYIVFLILESQLEDRHYSTSIIYKVGRQ